MGNQPIAVTTWQGKYQAPSGSANGVQDPKRHQGNQTK
jgi:hypothetical protein